MGSCTSEPQRPRPQSQIAASRERSSDHEAKAEPPRPGRLRPKRSDARTSGSSDHGVKPDRPRPEIEVTVSVCQARSCLNAGSESVLFEIEELTRGLGRCTVRKYGCLGECSRAPNARVVAGGSSTLHKRLKDVNASAALVKHVFGKAPSSDDVKRLIDVRQMKDRLASQRNHDYALWRLSGVTPVSKHSALFQFECGERRQGTLYPQGRTGAKPKTWHISLLAPITETSGAKVRRSTKECLPWIERDYTPISSAKDWENGKCEILIKIYADGLVTSWLGKQPVGSYVWLSKPMKTLCVPSLVHDGSSFRPANVLLILAGTGIVAAPQILQHRDPVKNFGFCIQSADQFLVPIYLIYSCRKDDTLMVADIHRWCSDDKMGLRQCILLLTDVNSEATAAFPNAQNMDGALGELQSLPNAKVLHARLSQEVLTEAVSRIPPGICRTVVSGPAAFNAIVKQMLVQCGVSDDSVTILQA